MIIKFISDCLVDCSIHEAQTAYDKRDTKREPQPAQLSPRRHLHTFGAVEAAAVTRERGKHTDRARVEEGHLDAVERETNDPHITLLLDPFCNDTRDVKC